MIEGPGLHLDFETRSSVDLTRSGVYRYAEHPSTAAYLFRYRLGDGPVRGWDEWEPLPQEVLDHIAAGRRVIAHNAGFERRIWNHVLPRQLGQVLPPMRIEQQDCTMARAAAVALPQKLDMLGPVLGTHHVKDKAGHALMLKMCKPTGFTEAGREIYGHDTAENREALGLYCEDDVLTECDADNKLPVLSDMERRVWELDQRINDRGIKIDLTMVSRAIEAVAVAKKRADAEMWRLTENAVEKCTQTARIKTWLHSRGIPCTSIAKGEIEELILAGEMVGDEAVGQVLALRRAAAKSSTAKLNTMLRTVSADGRVRGSLNYHGAATGRWAGRGMQPQNFPRVDEERDLPGVLAALRLLEQNRPPFDTVDALELMGHQPLDTLSKCLRPMLVAEEGHMLVGGDLSNIEGRLNAWMAGEEWKLQAFRDYDAGTGPDLYRVTAAKIVGVTPAEVTSLQRQGQGKVTELSLGYQGGPGAYVNMGANYGVKPWDVASQAKAITDPDLWAATRERYTKADSRGLEVEVWTGLRVIVDGWRRENSAITQSWWDLQDAAIAAVANPGSLIPVLGGKVHYLVSNGFLWCRLVSGRVLAYANPRLRRVKTGRTSRDGSPQFKWVVDFDGKDPFSGHWSRQSLYGGMQCNHVTQGTARDIMVHWMLLAEDAGFPLVLTVHDELLAEVAKALLHLLNDKSLVDLIVKHPPPYVPGLPLAAKAFMDTKYVK